MKRKTAQPRNRMMPTILASFILVLSIPLVIMGLSSLESTDTRSNAQAVPAPKCIVTFLYVDPSALEINKAVTLQVDGNTPGETISSITLNNGSPTTIFTKSYSTPASTVKETFGYTPTVLGQYTIQGTLSAKNAAGADITYPCLLSTGGAANATVVPENALPSFLTQPPTNAQNNIKVGDSYQYNMIAQDTDSWTRFGYSYTFTPRADWLRATVTKEQINSGTGTRLTINFQGVADVPASYLANIIIWDGYNGHTVSQSWIINVGQNQNDTPVVTVTKPTNGTTVTQGENITIEWNATDSNQILTYKLYVASNPGNAATWQPINTNLDFHVGKYILSTEKLTAGNYVAIVQAVDSYNPPATGTGTSGTFTVKAKPVETPTNPTTPTTPTTPTDDGRQLKEAEVTNIKPDDKSTIKNSRPTISATLLAMEEEKVKKETVILKVDDKEITSQAEIRDIKDGEASITYAPKEDLTAGTHKVTVSFEDTKGNKVSKDWTFTVEDTTTPEEFIEIFGYRISKRNAIIGGLIFLGIIILVLVVPWIIYGIFRKNNSSDGDNFYQTYSSYKPSPTSPIAGSGTQNSSYYNFTPEPIPVEDASQTYVTTTQTDTSTPVVTTPSGGPQSSSDYTSSSANYAQSTTEDPLTQVYTPVYTPAYTPVQTDYTQQSTSTTQTTADTQDTTQPYVDSSQTSVDTTQSSVAYPQPAAVSQQPQTPTTEEAQFASAYQPIIDPSTYSKDESKLPEGPVEKILYEAPDYPVVIDEPTTSNIPQSEMTGNSQPVTFSMPGETIKQEDIKAMEEMNAAPATKYMAEMQNADMSAYSSLPAADEIVPDQTLPQQQSTDMQTVSSVSGIQPQTVNTPADDAFSTIYQPQSDNTQVPPTQLPTDPQAQTPQSVTTPIAPTQLPFDQQFTDTQTPVTATDSVQSAAIIPNDNPVTTTPYTPADDQFANQASQTNQTVPATTIVEADTMLPNQPSSTPTDSTTPTNTQQTDTIVDGQLDTESDTSYPVEDEIDDSEAEAIRQLADELEKQYGQVSSDSLIDNAIASGGQVTAPSPTNSIDNSQPSTQPSNVPPSNPV